MAGPKPRHSDEVVFACLKKNDWNMNKTAKELGYSDGSVISHRAKRCGWNFERVKSHMRHSDEKVLACVEKFKGNIQKAAEELGYTVNTIRGRAKAQGWAMRVYCGRHSDKVILECITKHGGNMTYAAKELGYTISALSHRAKRHGWDLPKSNRKYSREYTRELLEKEYGPWPARLDEIQERVGYSHGRSAHILCHRLVSRGILIRTIRGNCRVGLSVYDLAPVKE